MAVVGHLTRSVVAPGPASVTEADAMVVRQVPADDRGLSVTVERGGNGPLTIRALGVFTSVDAGTATGSDLRASPAPPRST